MITTEPNHLAPSLLKRFTLFGLNGYKTISLSTSRRVKIVAGENGAGKTSLLNALYAILAGKQAVLFKIDFERIELEWTDGDMDTATRTSLFSTIDHKRATENADFDFFQEHGIETPDALSLLDAFVMGDEELIQTNPSYRTIYQESPLNKEEIYSRLKAVSEPAKIGGFFDSLHANVKKRLGELSVLYLPTYRRIEADFLEFRPRRPSGLSRSRNSRDEWDSDRLIKFGLDDVESRLKSISNEIRRETLRAYSSNSGETLEELISDSPDQSDGPAIDFESISLILSRIGKGNGSAEATLKGLLDNGGINEPRYNQLRKFLRQLIRVYTGRKGDEKAIEDFAGLINEYLMVGGQPEKYFLFDKQTVEVQVINRYTNLPVRLGALSSGEKQIVSVFARLLLEPERRYFIIIDEPELSLSIEWQERFLVDIAAAENCGQLIAITHSPFVYKNELASVAGSLEVTYEKTPSQLKESIDA